MCAAAATRVSKSTCAALVSAIESQAAPTTYVLGAGTFVCAALNGDQGLDIGAGKVVVIEGAGRDATVIDLDKKGRMFVVKGGSVTLNGLTVKNGKGPSSSSGGVVAMETNTLGGGAFEANLVSFIGCESGAKGGVLDSKGGTFTANQCVVSGCSATTSGGFASMSGGNAIAYDVVFIENSEVEKKCSGMS